MIITYYWPPSGGVGVQRWMNFAIQLKKRGWEPWVLTPENPQFEIKDEKLLERVEDIPVVRLPIWEPFNLFHALTGNKNRKNVQQGLILEKSQRSIKDNFMIWIRGNLLIPDPRVFWVRPAAKRAIKLIEEEGIPTIITTGPPHSIHLIGKRVKRKTGVKWLADFRDPWSKWDVLDKLKTSSFVRSIHKKLERSVIRESDTPMTVTNGFSEDLGGGLKIIHNGVTVSDSSSKRNISPKYFTIGYYGLLNELRNPSQLWQVLDQMCRENRQFAKRLHLRIGGIVSDSIKSEINRLTDLGTRVKFLGYLSHEEIFEEYEKCNILLLLQNKSDQAKGILPVKFFEYLSVYRMILCLGPRQSDLGNLMNERDVGIILGQNEVREIRSFIEDVFENERNPNFEDVNYLIEKFSHKNLADKLEELLT
ncbi:glycosyl transferase [Ekhidna sp. MALMAid0563]|uniref:glycosyl transferase n=1 Tax=Ekhidna sp. MALMAid0563 TaxID=3143937 RepID=UPI0032DE866C